MVFRVLRSWMGRGVFNVPPLEFDVRPERRDQNRPSILVVSGINNILQIRAQLESSPHMRSVIALYQVFAAVSQSSIPQNKTEPAQGKVLRVYGGNGIGCEGDSGAVEVPLPRWTEHDDAARKGLVNFRKRPRFGFAVVPSEAPPASDIWSYGLLEIDAEAILGRHLEGMVVDFRFGRFAFEIFRSHICKCPCCRYSRSLAGG